MLKALIRLLKTAPLLEPLLGLIDAVWWVWDRLAVWSVGPVSVKPATLVVFKFDALGDYLLFRPYLRHLKTHPPFAGYHLTLVAHEGSRTLAEAADRYMVDKFFWVNSYRLSSDPVYRFRIVRTLRKRGFAVAYGPTYSRVLVLDDYLSYATGAPRRIGVRGDRAARKAWEAWLGDQLFTDLLPSKAGILFEGERNRQTTQALLGAPVPSLAPSLYNLPLPVVETPPRYVVLSLGAGQAFRIWPMERFAAVVSWLREHRPAYTILLTGTAEEIVYARDLLARLPDHAQILDRTGQLSLLEVLSVLRGARLLLANETGTVHLAAAVGTPALVISQGRTLVRWHPYPPGSGTRLHYVYPDFLEENRHRFTELAETFNPESRFTMADVPVERVLGKLGELIE